MMTYGTSYGPPPAASEEPQAQPDQVYFEDIEEGAELPPRSKGPLTVTDLVVFAGASNDFAPIHHDQEYAKSVGGLPDIILHGQCKIAFMAQVVTDWIGLGGWIRKLGAQYRGMDVVGDTVVSRGRVQRKYTQDDEYLVDLELWNENGRAGITAKGSATVALPSRAGNRA